ncbi:MAG: transcription antitermination factor NusB [Bacteroidales bacterium]|jgi:N utilization substance protein B
MISRRLLRVKALQILYAYRASENDNVFKTEKELIFSIEKSYDLYHLILLLLVDISNYAVQRTDIARSKYFPTEEEANPNTRFIDNRLITRITDSRKFSQYLETRKISWSNEEELIKSFYRNLLEWDVYQEYMNSSEDSFNQDKKFISRMVAELILPDEYLQQVLEEQSIYWNDDIEFIGSMVIKTLSRWKENSEMPVLSMFSNEDDRLYVIELLRKTILHADEYQELIKKFSANWDFERLALMDILIMQMAIAEAIHFPSIPAKVTLNEYIEISKYYSTEKSSYFINGILDKIFMMLRTDEKIKKTGRGLIGEV